MMKFNLVLAFIVLALVIKVNSLMRANLETKKQLLELTKLVHIGITGEEYEK